MLHIVLHEPEIPANTGNIARTCAATGSALHLIRPLGFDVSERAVRRAGLDYWHLVDVHVYDDLDDFFRKTGAEDIWLLSSYAPNCYTDVTYKAGCYLFFGKETKGLPQALLDQHRDRALRLPMRSEARCLNLSSAATAVCYEALRQMGFPNLEQAGVMAQNL